MKSKKPLGRPRFTKERMGIYRIRLPPTYAIAAKKLGKNNLSAGIRQLIEEWSVREQLISRGKLI